LLCGRHPSACARPAFPISASHSSILTAAGEGSGPPDVETVAARIDASMGNDGMEWASWMVTVRGGQVATITLRNSRAAS
jgi:hypothetical protein